MKLKLLAAAAALLAATPAAAATAVVVSPLGQSGAFQWDNGLGPIDQIDSSYDQDAVTFSLLANAGDTVDASLFDCCVTGDQFALYLNNVLVAPTSVTTPSGLYNYLFDDILLASGVNIFRVDVTTLAAGFETGGADYSFAAVAPSVPEPGTWAMLLLGFGAVGAAMRQRRKPRLGSPDPELTDAAARGDLAAALI